MKRLFVHAGFHKTGTTYIQQFLRRNQSALSGHLSYYLDRACGDASYANHTLAAIIRKTAHREIAIPETKEVVWQRFFDFVHAASCDRVLLSSEVFTEGVDFSFLHSQLKSLDVTFIFYVRRQDEFFESLYPEVVKHGRCESVNEFYAKWKRRGFNFYRRVLDFEEALPEAKIIVKEYNRALFPSGDIARDLFQSIGVRLSETEFRQLRKVGLPNQRMPADYVEIMRRFNSLPVSYAEKAAFRGYLLGLLQKEPKLSELPRFRVSDEMRACIVEMAAESNRQLVKRYRVDGEFFSEESLFGRNEKTANAP